MIKIISSVLIITFFFTSISGQDLSKPRYSLNGGLGFYLPKEKSAENMTLFIEANMFRTDYVFSIAFSQQYELDFFGKSPHEEFYTFSAMVGKTIARPNGHMSYSTGLSYLYGITRGEFLYDNPLDFSVGIYKKKEISTIGLPLRASAEFTRFKYIGIGAKLFANLNLKRTYFGGGIYLSVLIPSK